VNHVAINNIDLCQDFDLRDSQLRRFWNLEAMGITDTNTAPHSAKDNAMLSSFADSLRIENGRAVVPLTKKEHVIPTDNHTNAQRRFQSLTKRFATTNHFKTKYEKKCWTTYFNTKSKSLRPDSLQRQCSTYRITLSRKKTQNRKMANRF